MKTLEELLEYADCVGLENEDAIPAYYGTGSLKGRLDAYLKCAGAAATKAAIDEAIDHKSGLAGEGDFILRVFSPAAPSHTFYKLTFTDRKGAYEKFSHLAAHFEVNGGGVELFKGSRRVARFAGFAKNE